MSIATQITRIKENIASAYEIIDSKGGTVPSDANSANLADAIDGIPTGSGLPVDAESLTPLVLGINADGWYYSDNEADAVPLYMGRNSNGDFYVTDGATESEE